MTPPFVVNLKNPEDSPEKLAEKLNSLTYAIDHKVIRGAVKREEFDELKNRTTKYISGNKERIDTNDLRWHGGGISSPRQLTIYNDTVNGTINGINKVFTVSNTIAFPIALYLANSIYQATVDYTVSGITITMVLAPDASLSGQPFFLAHT